jgi:hypothetical protein
MCWRAWSSATSWVLALATVSATLAFVVDSTRLALARVSVRIVLAGGLSAAALAVMLSLIVGTLLAALVAVCDRISLMGIVGRTLAPLLIVAASAWLANTIMSTNHRQDPGMHLALVVSSTLIIVLSLPASKVRAHRLFRVCTFGLTAGIFLVDAVLPRWYYREIHDLMAMITVAELLILVTPWRRTLRRRRLLRPMVAVVSLSLAILFSVDWVAPGWQPRAREHGLYSGAVARAVRALVDFDGDGFSPVAWGGDCNDFSSARNPLAVDGPGLGDLNCNGIDPPKFPTDAQRGLAPPAGEPNLAPGAVDLVVLATVDALRADSLTPRLMPNYFAAGSLGIAFERAYSNGTRTSITLPLAQKNYRGGEPLATRLFKAGIETTAVIADAGLEGTAAIARTYERVVKPDQGRWQGLQATEGALRALDEAGSNKRHFLWIHLYDAHTPYPWVADPPVPTPPGLDPSYARYATGVKNADFAIGELLAGLARRGRLEKTLIIASADHGEAFGEHNMLFHSASTYEPLVHIPLVMAGPGISPQHCTQLVSQADIFPTVLGAFGLMNPQDEFLGRSWLRLRSAPNAPLHRFVVIRSAFATSGGDVMSPMLAIVHGQHKLAKSLENGITELFNLVDDPGENTDLWPSDPGTGKYLEHSLELYRDIVGYPADEDLSDMKTYGARMIGAAGEVY